MKTTHAICLFMILFTLALAPAAWGQEKEMRAYSEIKLKEGSYTELLDPIHKNITDWIHKGVNIKELRESTEKSFELLDQNDNGRITLDEIDIDFDEVPKEEMRSAKQRMTLAQQKFLSWNREIDRFEISDTNKDKVLDRKEYETKDKTVRTHLLQLGIEDLDLDKNGSVDRKEYAANLDALEELDEDGDGFLSMQEFASSGDTSLVRDSLMHKLGTLSKNANTMIYALDSNQPQVMIGTEVNKLKDTIQVERFEFHEKKEEDSEDKQE